jgi:hypothetical protein
VEIWHGFSSFCIKKICNMKYLATWLVFAFLPVFLLAQSDVPRLSKMPIGESGCSAYFPEGMPAFEASKSEDGADVYTSEMELGEYRFGCIAVKFAEPFTDSSPEEMEDLLISYLDFLKEQFEITDAIGYGKGHLQDGHPDVRGVIDYWQDAEETQFAIKGWVNQRYLGIMFIYGATEYPIFNVQQMYLDGFRFGE